jgi:hypothetical protein
MPVLSKGSLKIDYTDDGQGQAVVLVHSSVSGNRQWRSLTEALKEGKEGHYPVFNLLSPKGEPSSKGAEPRRREWGHEIRR